MTAEFENLKNENARLTELVKVLEEQIKSLNLRLRLERELASKQEFNPSSQMQISQEKMDEFIRQNIIGQMNAFKKEENLLSKPKERKYRPCTLDNFGLNIGDLIKFRKKDDHAFEIETMYMGYIKNNGIVKVMLGNTYYSLEELFDSYEWFDKDSNTWEMFGVAE